MDRRITAILILVCPLLVSCDGGLLTGITHRLVESDTPPQPLLVDVVDDPTAELSSSAITETLDGLLPQVVARSGTLRVWRMGASPSATHVVAQIAYAPPTIVSARGRRRAAAAFLVSARAQLARDVGAALGERPPSLSPLAEAITVVAASDAPSGATREIILLTDYEQNSALAHFARRLPERASWFVVLDRERVLLPGSLRGVTLRCAYFTPRSSLRETAALRDLWQATLVRAGSRVVFSSGPPVEQSVPMHPSLLFLLPPIFPVTWWWSWRVGRLGFRHGWLGVPSQPERAIRLFVHMVPRAPAGLSLPAPEAVAHLRALDERLSAYWPWRVEIVLGLSCALVEVRACTRPFVLLGLAVADALMFGIALTVMMIAATALVLWAWRTPYDGTSRRTLRRILAGLLYLVLVGSLVVLRVALVDAGEELIVRWSAALLLLACTVGPSFGAEVLVRRAFMYVPLLLARARERHALREARSLAGDQAAAAARADHWHQVTEWLAAVYEEAYARGLALRGRS